MAHLDPDRLERQIHRTLRALPDRRAPRSLEARVMAAIAASRALPWWHQSFVHWPAPARTGFFGVSLGLLVAVTLASVVGWDAALAAAGDWMAPVVGLRSALGSVADAGLIIWQRIPTVWIYGGLAAFGGLYAALFGLGATAYRTLIVNR